MVIRSGAMCSVERRLKQGQKNAMCISAVSTRTATIVLLVLLTAAGAALRLYRLGETDTRGDEVELLIPPISEYGPLENCKRDFHAFKSGRILVLPRMTTSALVKGFGLPSTRSNVRLTYAIFGFLTIPALFLLGLKLGDRRLAWILAFLGTINPYLVFYSRYAHVYAFPLLFNALTAAFAAGVLLALAAARPPRRADVIGLGVAATLACHSHMSSWPFAGLVWGLVALLLWMRRGCPWFRGAAHALAASFAAWLLTLLPWITLFVSAMFTAQESFIQGGFGPHSFPAMWRLPFVMTWGGGLPWLAVTVILLLTGVAGGLASARWRKVVLVALGMGIVLFAAMSLVMYKGAKFFNLRYYTPLWVVFNLLGGLGVLLASEWIAARVRAATGRACPAGPVAAVGCGVVAAFMAMPLWWIVHLPGNPTPYTLVCRWLDEHLPKGTPVVVDRWFEPWNELRYHAPTSVVATFTVPAEPPDTFIRNNWRQTVKQFFAKYPDAAYLELTKSFWEHPDIGPWDWPRQHFARHVAITNQQALALRRAVLVPDEAYYTRTHGRAIVDIFYNTREDAVSQARAAGTNALVLYGPGWGYIKLWQQLGDFRDWRVLEDKAALDIYNLTPQTNAVDLVIRGMAVNGAKRVVCESLGQADFQHLKLAEWRLTRVALAPGLNRLILSDPIWSLARIPWLVDQVEVAGGR